MALTDSSGAVVAEYEYDVYGEVTSQTGTADTEFDFAGEETNASTGLQYLRARYMDPVTGRFTSRDPLAGSAKWMENGFTYVSGGPVNAVDPTGLCKWWEHLIGCAETSHGDIQCVSDGGLGAACVTEQGYVSIATWLRECFASYECTGNVALALIDLGAICALAQQYWCSGIATPVGGYISVINEARKCYETEKPLCTKFALELLGKQLAGLRPSIKKGISSCEDQKMCKPVLELIESIVVEAIGELLPVDTAR